jgi:hypothetical protein
MQFGNNLSNFSSTVKNSPEAFASELFSNHAGDRDRTGTGIATHGILSPGRLPVPPRRHLSDDR